jgi:transcriptional accessory protein Tex/SPT6
MALQVLEGGRSGWDLTSLVDGRVAGRATLAEVEAGLQHIVADVIVHDKATCDLVRDLQRQARIELQVKKAAAAATAAGTAAKAKKEKAATAKAAAKPSKGKSTEEEARKFENYFSFCCPVTHVKPHQVLAINRGESLKVLSVKVSLPDSWLLGALERHVRTRQALPFILWTLELCFLVRRKILSI